MVNFFGLFWAECRRKAENWALGPSGIESTDDQGEKNKRDLSTYCTYCSKQASEQACLGDKKPAGT